MYLAIYFHFIVPFVNALSCFSLHLPSSVLVYNVCHLILLNPVLPFLFPIYLPLSPVLCSTSFRGSPLCWSCRKFTNSPERYFGINGRGGIGQAEERGWKRERRGHPVKAGSSGATETGLVSEVDRERTREKEEERASIEWEGLHTVPYLPQMSMQWFYISPFTSGKLCILSLEFF